MLIGKDDERLVTARLQAACRRADRHLFGERGLDVAALLNLEPFRLLLIPAGCPLYNARTPCAKGEPARDRLRLALRYRAQHDTGGAGPTGAAGQLRRMGYHNREARLLPAALLHRNEYMRTTNRPVAIDLYGCLERPICLHNDCAAPGLRF